MVAGIASVLGVVMTLGTEYLYYHEEKQKAVQEQAIELERAKESLAIEISRELNKELSAARSLIRDQSEKIRELETAFALQEADFIRLKMKYDLASGSPRANLIRYLDAFRRRPAWAKVCDPVDRSCINLHANDAYEYRYCISAKRYRGKPDSDVWPPEMATEFLKNDLEVLDLQDSREYLEPVFDCAIGENISYRFVKFHIELTDGTHIIAGLQLNI